VHSTASEDEPYPWGQWGVWMQTQMKMDRGTSGRGRRAAGKERLIR
jgi:hypothetical protein